MSTPSLNVCPLLLSTRVILKVMSNHFVHANWEQQKKESKVVDGTSCCVVVYYMLY